MRSPLPSPDRFVVDEEGNKQAVIIPLQQYERLLQDLHDLATVAERRTEEPVSLEEVKERLKRDGLLLEQVARPRLQNLLPAAMGRDSRAATPKLALPNDGETGEGYRN